MAGKDGKGNISEGLENTNTNGRFLWISCSLSPWRKLLSYCSPVTPDTTWGLRLRRFQQRKDNLLLLKSLSEKDLSRKCCKIFVISPWGGAKTEKERWASNITLGVVFFWLYLFRVWHFCSCHEHLPETMITFGERGNRWDGERFSRSYGKGIGLFSTNPSEIRSLINTHQIFFCVDFDFIL